MPQNSRVNTVSYPHISLDSEGRPWIDGCNTKVIEVALDHLAHGWTAEEIHFQHPHLPLARIHSALAYYYDHREEMNAVISAQNQRVQSQHTATPASALAERVSREPTYA